MASIDNLFGPAVPSQTMSTAPAQSAFSQGQDLTKESFERLIKSRDSLNTRKIQLEASRDETQKRISEIEAEIKASYGLSNLSELDTLIANKKAELLSSLSSVINASQNASQALQTLPPDVQSQFVDLGNDIAALQRAAIDLQN